jgi:hypothetical protein
MINAVAYRIRFGTFLRKQARIGLKSDVPKSQVALYVFMALALFPGVAAPKVAPDSALARWLAEPYAQLAYYTWCFLATWLAGVVVALIEQFRGAKGKDSA